MNFAIQYPGSAYEPISYPGGELQVRLRPETIPQVHAADIIEIDARIVTASSLIGLVLLADALRGTKPGIDMALNIPYLPYARADRRFTDGDCYGLQVFGDILRTCRFSEIYTLDVHNPAKAYSHVSSFLKNINPMPLIQTALDIFQPDAVLFPDAGAAKRYEKICNVPLFFATKTRDPESGKLLKFEVPVIADGSRILIIDDICDGGGTFTGIAQELRHTGRLYELGLYVTHGIFSRGLKALSEFSHVYTTDSFAPFSSTPFLTVFDAFTLIRQHQNPTVKEMVERLP